MNMKITPTATRYLIIAVALLHTSHGQTVTPLLQVTYNFGGMPERVSLECLNSNGVIRDGVLVTYTFMDPEGRVENSVDVEGRSYEFTNHPTNESLITCTIDNVESETVKVVAIPRYTTGVILINQYVYSDSAVADVVCPFEINGRLGEPVEISWSFAESLGNRVGPINNATNGAYWLEEEDNRILHVNISTLGSLGYQCAGSVEICRHPTSCMQSPPTWSPSPTFVVLPTLDRLSVTEPVSVTVDQYESATFNCTATGSGDLIIEWICSDGSNCDMSSTSSSRNNGSVTSKLVITGATSNLTVTCNVMRDLTSLTSGESASVEVWLPIERVQRTAQLIFMPVPTTVTAPSSVSPSAVTVIYIILTLVLPVIIVAIIILIVCSCSVCHYHYRKETRLGQRLRRIFNLKGDPASHIYDVPTKIHDTQLIADEREVTIAHPINHETRMLMQENSAYGTDIAIAPEIATEQNIAYGHTSRSNSCEKGIEHPRNEYGSRAGPMIPLQQLRIVQFPPVPLQ